MNPSTLIPTLRAAGLGELEALTGLCLRSKAVWGYDHAFMVACRAELTLTPEDLATSSVQVAVVGSRLVGVAQIKRRDNDVMLEKLFVEPDLIGAGIGKVLFEWATTQARMLDGGMLVIEADPGAVGFYEGMGAVRAGDVPSGSVSGRRLPRLLFALR